MSDFSPTADFTGSVQDRVRAHLQLAPDTPAVVDVRSGAALTYRELWDRSGSLADHLLRRDVGAGVGVAVDRSVHLVVALLGIARAGAAYVPIDRAAPPARIDALRADADVRVVLDEQSVDTLSVDAVAGAAGPADTPLDSNTPLDSDTPLYVAYTSGSTGSPKGVVVPHRAVLRLADAADYCPIRPGDRVASLANPAFDATTFEVWSTLIRGATLVVMPRPTDIALDAWTDALRTHRINVVFLTTSLFHTVARERPSAFASLDTLVVGGEQLDAATVRAVLAAQPPRRLVNGYGPTEATTFSTALRCTTDTVPESGPVPIGYPLPGSTVRVRAEDGTPVAPGETGELWIGGAGLALGYLGRPELTAERFVTDADGERYYRSGDLVREQPDGSLLALGRRDRQIKLRGYRIELDEIERVAATGPADQVFVEHVGDGAGASLVGFVAGGDPQTVAAHLREQLPEYMVPMRWSRLTNVPLGPTGKADRTAMLAWLDAAAPAADIDDPVLAVLVELWVELTGTPLGSVDDDLVSAGGDSILAIRLATRATDRLGVPVDPADVLLAASFAELATDLAADLATAATRHAVAAP